MEYIWHRVVLGDYRCCVWDAGVSESGEIDITRVVHLCSFLLLVFAVRADEIHLFVQRLQEWEVYKFPNTSLLEHFIRSTIFDQLH